MLGDPHKCDDHSSSGQQLQLDFPLLLHAAATSHGSSLRGLHSLTAPQACVTPRRRVCCPLRRCWGVASPCACGAAAAAARGGRVQHLGPAGMTGRDRRVAHFSLTAPQACVACRTRREGRVQHLGPTGMTGRDRRVAHFAGGSYITSFTAGRPTQIRRPLLQRPTAPTRFPTATARSSYQAATSHGSLLRALHSLTAPASLRRFATQGLLPF